MKNQTTGRIASIDALRGIVIIIMALDHVRNYFHATNIDLLDVSETNPELFFARWITHLCAPVFVLLAGVSAGLSIQNGKSKTELSKYLLSRGLVLIILELTIVSVGWQFNFIWWQPFQILQVIWVLGAGMVLLAGAIWLPRGLQIPLSLVIVLGHNLLHLVSEDVSALLGPVSTLLYGPGTLEIGGITFLALYPLLPWFGVILLGYLLAELYKIPEDRRQSAFLIAGITSLVAFFLLRAGNLYGDPVPWAAQQSLAMSVVSFFNTAKYPPSLLFLLMTLGPALIYLSIMDKRRGPVTERLEALGQASLFFYLIHIYVIHAAAIAVGFATGYDVSAQLRAFYAGYPSDFGFGLVGVYVVWISVVVALYPLCIWYAKLKRRRAHPVLRYI